jgi:hypothetical protein
MDSTGVGRTAESALVQEAAPRRFALGLTRISRCRSGPFLLEMSWFFSRRRVGAGILVKWLRIVDRWLLGLELGEPFRID